MLLAFLLVLAVTAGGFALTYLYDEDSPFLTRVAIGSLTGMVAQALLGFALTLRFGPSLPVVGIATVPFLSPLLLFRYPEIRRRAGKDVRRLLRFRGRSRHRFMHLVISVLLLGMLVWVFQGIVYGEDGAIYTNNHHNNGDLPWHVALVRGFTVGGNYPPEHLQFAGSRLTYPFLCDFITAEFILCGANFTKAFLLTNLILAFGLLALLQQWAFRLTRSPFVLIATPFLAFFNGGWGWLMLFGDAARASLPLHEFFLHLPHDYTILPSDPHAAIPLPNYRWGTSITVLLTTQRSILLGMPLALAALLPLVAVLRMRLPADGVDAAEVRQQRRTRLTAAGAITGLLPLCHTHTTLVLLVVAGLYALPELRRRDRSWLDWLAFFVPALVLMTPQGWLLLSGTRAKTSSFFGFALGWDHGDDNPIVFWLRNTGPFLPLLAVALLWRGRRLLSPLVLRFWLPFVVWLLLPNLLRFAPWTWDNIKVLFYGYLATIPVVLLVLARLWRQRAFGKITAVALLAMMTLAGAVDVFRIATGQLRQRIYSAEDLAFAEAVNRAVPPACRIIAVPAYNHAITFAGRRLICGYTGHLWSHGFNADERVADIRRIYAGAPDADALLKKYDTDYIVVGPQEYADADLHVNPLYLRKFTTIVSVGAYRLLRVSR